jgi:hypothetical protein
LSCLLTFLSFFFFPFPFIFAISFSSIVAVLLALHSFLGADPALACDVVCFRVADALNWKGDCCHFILLHVFTSEEPALGIIDGCSGAVLLGHRCGHFSWVLWLVFADMVPFLAVSRLTKHEGYVYVLVAQTVKVI